MTQRARPRVWALTLLVCVVGCASPATKTSDTPIASGEPPPRFATDGPDAEALGASMGYPKGTPATFWRAPWQLLQPFRRDLPRPAHSQGIGTVRVILDQPENQPHRGEIANMLVHRRVRRRGIGAALLAAAERRALSAGKTLLVLDTANGDAERLYARQGWQRCGEIPNYALWPNGTPCATTIFFKFLRD